MTNFLEEIKKTFVKSIIKYYQFLYAIEFTEDDFNESEQYYQFKVDNNKILIAFRNVIQSLLVDSGTVIVINIPSYIKNFFTFNSYYLEIEISISITEDSELRLNKDLSKFSEFITDSILILLQNDFKDGQLLSINDWNITTQGNLNIQSGKVVSTLSNKLKLILDKPIGKLG